MEMIEEELVPWLLWRIWKNRNTFLFRNKDYQALEIIQKASEDAREWKSREEVKKVEVKQHIVEGPEKRWSPPPSSHLKCNIDGLWKQESREGGIGGF